MKLKELFDCNFDIDIKDLEDDSRNENKDCLYFCIEGLTVDGHDFVDQAIKNGAVAIVASKKIETNIPVIYVEDTSKAMNDALNKFNDNILDKLNLIGITGTDGKTTTTTIIHQLLDNCAVIGSNGVESNSLNIKTNNTTPLPKELFDFFNQVYKDGCNSVAMEVSSERILTKRMNGIKFNVSGITNISYEHINKHKTMENYVACKAKIFENTFENGICIINSDMDYKENFIKASKASVITYGIDNNADVMAKDIILEDNKMSFKLTGIYGEYNIDTNLSGKYNIYNILIAIIVCVNQGMSMAKIILKLKNLKPVLGRANFIDKGQPYKVIIDYAHTPNALKNLLEYVKSFTKNKVITVTGSAGGKDASKRPAMGKVVLELSDYAIFTADDSRFEDPNKIIADMISESDLNNYEIIIDRRSAIKKAIDIASDGDTVVIAGRGNDDIQPINGENIKFNDIVETEKILDK